MITDLAIGSRRDLRSTLRADDRTAVILANVLFVLALFPYFKVIPGLAAEVQPVGGLIGIGAWILLRRRPGIGRAAFPLFLVIAAYSAIFLIQFELGSMGVGLDTAAEALAILIAPLGLALGLVWGIRYVSPRILTASVIISALVGTLQLWAPDFLRITGISALLASLIPRLADATQGLGGRGVPMLAPEPSYAAPSILLMLVAAYWLYLRGRISVRLLAFLIAMLVWMVILNASVSLLISLVLLGLMLGFGLARHHITLVVPAAALLILSLWGLGSFKDSDNRAVRVTGEISALITSGEANLENIVTLSQFNGSGRLSSVVQGYSAALANNGAGLGIGSWDQWLDAPGADSMFLAARPKPFAYGAFVAMTLGLPGLAALSWCLWNLLRRSMDERPAAFAIATVASGLLGILINAPASLPAYWVMILFALPQSQTWARTNPASAQS